MAVQSLSASMNKPNYGAQNALEPAGLKTKAPVARKEAGLLVGTSCLPMVHDTRGYPSSAWWPVQ
eukprot:6899346-Prorocentrum_lima.AAC.1